MSKLLEEKDIQVLKNMMESIMDTRFSQMEANMDTKLSHSENLVLSELERTRAILENKIETVQKNPDQLKDYYRITKSENDNASLLLQIVSDLQKRVTALEKRPA